MTDKPDREALRQRLREKIRGKRSGESDTAALSTRLREDPVTAMLSMGLDDPELLGQAKSLVAHPEAFLSKITGETDVERKTKKRRHRKKKKVVEVEKTPLERVDENEAESDDEEEAPPPSVFHSR